MRPGRTDVVVTAILYFGIIFTLAFAMGVARVLVVAPRVGPAIAVLIEVPIILAASWVVARRLLHHRTFGFLRRFAVGGIAFTLLMACEVLLAAILLGQSVSEWAVAVATPLGLGGLAGQIGFAAIPVFATHDRQCRRVVNASRRA